MKFNEWIKYVKEKGGVNTDGAYGQQCMDLYNHYCINVLGMEKGKTGADCAKNLLNNNYVKERCEVIKNYDKFIPQKGDIAIWTGSKYGHVAICLDGSDINVLKTIDQNWHLDQKLTEENHDYFKLTPLYFFRPKNQENIKEGDKLYLPASVQSWNIYPLNKKPIVGNECGELYPSKFGGLEYDILHWTIPNVVCVIRTRDYGEVQIYVAKDTPAVIR